MRYLKRLSIATLLVMIGFYGGSMITWETKAVTENYAPTPVIEQKKLDITVKELHKIVNAERNAVGVASLKLDKSLNASAQEKCADMTEYSYYAHTNPKTKERGVDLITNPGVTYVAENLDQETSDFKFTKSSQIIDDWLNSKEHANTMLSGVYTATGYAICNVNSYTTVVQHFGAL